MANPTPIPQAVGAAAVPATPTLTDAELREQAARHGCHPDNGVRFARWVLAASTSAPAEPTCHGCGKTIAEHDAMLRCNPAGYWKQRAEQAEEAYLNMRDWAAANGVDTTAYNRGAPDAAHVGEQAAVPEPKSFRLEWGGRVVAWGDAIDYGKQCYEAGCATPTGVAADESTRAPDGRVNAHDAMVEALEDAVRLIENLGGNPKFQRAAIAKASGERPSAPAPEGLRHSTKENGDCPHWCKACAVEAATRAPAGGSQTCGAPDECPFCEPHERCASAPASAPLEALLAVVGRYMCEDIARGMTGTSLYADASAALASGFKALAASSHQAAPSGSGEVDGSDTRGKAAPGEMRAAFMAWVETQGCDTDGAWSAWQGCWNFATTPVTEAARETVASYEAGFREDCLWESIEKLRDALAASPRQPFKLDPPPIYDLHYAGAQRDREEDRRRFFDPAFNRWLDDPIADGGYTVWNMLDSAADAWAGWNAHACGAYFKEDK